jgi:hypothetical protein
MGVSCEENESKKTTEFNCHPDESRDPAPRSLYARPNTVPFLLGPDFRRDDWIDFRIQNRYPIPKKTKPARSYSRGLSLDKCYIIGLLDLQHSCRCRTCTKHILHQ